MKPMDQLLLRVEHAWDCLQTFRTREQSFLSSNPYRVWQEVEQESKDNLIYIEQTAPFPFELAFMAGDCVHNQRATLDNLVAALPGAESQQSAFVILDRPPADDEGRPISFAERAWQLKGTDPATISLIEGLQPYQQTRASYGSQAPIGLQLWRIEELSTRDKHRTPSIVARLPEMASPDDPGWVITTPGSSDPDPRWVVTVPEQDPFYLSVGTFQERRELWRVAWRGEGDPPEVQLRPDVALEVVFGEGVSVAGMTVESLLIELHNCVRYDVLPRFEEFLQSQG